MTRTPFAFFLFFLGAVTVAAAMQPKTIQVAIERLAFSPARIDAKVGDTIEWINEDGLDHTATLKGGSEILISAHKTGHLRLQNPGSFDYICRFHPNMKGRIIVRP
ncbi:cupredoxin domain-containing protein [Sinorhizobium alkalisoli]|uniref:cupredoxin domain-containing protein n=1 Tax=Sinorhizobium alkalisoli TaxID=1752398 RepID=UPI00124C18BE|nr:cupredoxin family copper-binding protein [Sinorhizobium alkalisoli]QFI68636.1 Copper binding protein, plastocyanin/azurin family [Sinorhizobium alkalisoli]